MTRRELPRYAVTALIAVTCAVVAATGEAEAQPGRIPRLGVIAGESPGKSPCVDALRRGLDELGLVEGRTHALEMRWAEGHMDAFPRLAADLVRQKVDVIVSAAGPAAEAVKQATTSIPIVLASSFYPVELGIIASLAHPGGNVTGVTHFTPELMAKRVQLLKELVPASARFAVLRLPGHIHDLVVNDMAAAARQLGVDLQVLEVRRADDLAPAFVAAAKGRADAIMSTQTPFFLQNNAAIAQLALRHRLPSLSGEPAAADAGTLVFYGPSIAQGCQRAAHYVDRVLKGARPSDLPVEQPTRFELVINARTAKTLGITVPQSLLLRADRLIQ